MAEVSTGCGACGAPTVNGVVRHKSGCQLGDERVDHPKHYNSHPARIECIDVVEHLTFNIGNAIKYLWRAGLKSDDAIEDLRKAVWYVNREIERLTKVRA